MEDEIKCKKNNYIHCCILLIINDNRSPCVSIHLHPVGPSLRWNSIGTVIFFLLLLLLLIFLTYLFVKCRRTQSRISSWFVQENRFVLLDEACCQCVVPTCTHNLGHIVALQQADLHQQPNHLLQLHSPQLPVEGTLKRIPWWKNMKKYRVIINLFIQLERIIQRCWQRRAATGLLLLHHLLHFYRTNWLQRQEVHSPCFRLRLEEEEEEEKMWRQKGFKIKKNGGGLFFFVACCTQRGRCNNCWMGGRC